MTTQNPTVKEVAILATKKAGEILMHHYGSIAVEFKDDNFHVGSMVTKADRESEDCIVALIKKNFPEHGIYGEEGTNEKTDAEYVWYIDPLDGTSNFTRNIPLFGISIGVVHNGEPVCGILYFPAIDLLVEAEKGTGAFANGKKISVSQRPIEQGLYYSGGRYKSDHLNQLQPDIAKAVGLIKIIDASSYALAQIAMGDAEVYFLTNVPHDVVAGVCIVREAGGMVTDGEGGDWHLASEKILVAPPTMHGEIVLLLRGR
ncbi:MAG: inositol monophosphatase [Candidatus Pacebacteria bacterium]|nr:inositol monophosphatase [Candidatus Paceibacterota bacterium]